MEEWKQIPGYEGLYSISTLGRVRRDLSYHGICGGRIKAQTKNDYGYYQVGLSKKSHCKTYRVHHLMAMCFLGPRGDGLEVNHKDGNKKNNALSNLEFVTPARNIEHGKENKLFVYGVNHHNAKLNDNSVRQIRTLHTLGASIRGIARLYSVDQNCISLVIKNRTWKHVNSEAA